MESSKKRFLFQNNIFWVKLSWLIVTLLLLVLLIAVVILGWLLYYRSRALPGLQILHTPIGGFSREQILALIDNKLDNNKQIINLVYKENKWEIDLSKVNYKVDRARSAHNSINWGKEWPSIMKVLSLTGNIQELPLVYSVDHDLLDNQIENITRQIETTAIEPEIQVSLDGVVTSVQGTLGKKIVKSELDKQISYSLAWLPDEVIEVPVVENDLRASDESLREAEGRAKNWLSKSLTLVYGENQTMWDGAKLASLVTVNHGFSQTKILQSTDMLSQEINKPAKDAVFEFDSEKGRVKEFRAEENGLALEKEPFVKMLNGSLASFENEATNSAIVNVPVLTTSPKIKADEINNLGIKELIGIGESHFKGSISSRLYNIGLAANRINGVIIPPGEEFSFVNSIGEISSSTGYQPAYIIMNGQTILGDGGGVCQVSTTVFRAALNTGLPINQRHAHSYRVAYYEQESFPGLDATVYPPSVDLKFLNDTSSHILLQTTIDQNNTYLKVELFGTSDGRTAEITKPRVWDVIKPADDLYIDDPSLPIGQIKQTEHRINGAKAAFDWKVMRNGEVLQEKTFTSVFRPWQAVYLRGTKTN